MRLNQFVSKVINLGAGPLVPRDVALRVRIANILSILMGLMMGVFTTITNHTLLVSVMALATTLFIGAPFVNALGFSRVGRLVPAVVGSSIILFSIAAYNDLPPDRMQILRLFIFAIIMMPLMLYTQKENLYKILCCTYVIACFFAAPVLNGTLGIFDYQLTTSPSVVYAMFYYITPSFFILLTIAGFIFVNQYDNRLLNQLLAEQQNQNEMLRQKEMQLAQALARTEEAVREALVVQEQLAHSKAELEQKAQGLLANKDNMRRMVRRLRINQVELEQKQTELEEKQFIDTGLARLAETARVQTDKPLNEWAEAVLNLLVGYVQGSQAALYMANDQLAFALTAGYAHNGHFSYASVFKPGEGMLGEVARQKKPLVLQGQGVGELRVKTGLYEIQPDSIVALPLVFHQAVQGVLEVVFLSKPLPRVFLFLEAAAQLLAVHMQSMRNQREIKNLLQEARLRADQLQQQDETLRQTITDLRETQDEMLRVQQDLALQEANLKGLINNTEDSIILIDRNYRIILMNDAIKARYRKAGKYLAVGETIFNYLSPDIHAEWQGYYDRALAG